MQENQYGQVITFYSYKGGTGRTMALANVACLLARKQSLQKGILMIDWDLEAPGLHRFFYPKIHNMSDQVDKSFEETPGLIDLFNEFDNFDIDKFGLVSNPEELIKIILSEVDIHSYIQKTEVPQVYMMKAGKFDENYPVRVNTFHWDKFYEKFPWLFRALAEELAKKFDYILIDSRTGITDTSGICTMIMPERLVVVFVPNQQSLTGISALLKRAIEYRKLSDDLRPLVVFPLPSRIEANQPELREKWRKGDEVEHIPGYQHFFEELFTDIYGLSLIDLEAYFNKVQIQHIPYYAYGEKIAVEMEKSEDSLSIARSYLNFVEGMSSPSPWESYTPPTLSQYPEGNSTRIEIWIHNKKILTADKGKLLFGRVDEDKNIYPNIDLSPYLSEHVFKISRKQALLTEIKGSWFLSLHEEGRSPVYLKDVGRLMPGQEYEITDETRIGFGGQPNYAYLYVTVKTFIE